MTTADHVKALILTSLVASPAGRVPNAITISDETDLRLEGLIDSFGFVRLLANLEQRLGMSIDLSELDPAQLTNVGALSRHIAASCSAA
jgi:acyl carrier protein